MRKNNIDDMTIREQIEVLKEHMCEGFCRYVNQYNIPQEELDKICASCPLTKL